MKENRQVQVSGLDVDKARENTAGIKDNMCLPQFQTYILGGEAVRPITFSIPRGALGYFPQPVPSRARTRPSVHQQFNTSQAPIRHTRKIRLAIDASNWRIHGWSRQQRQDTAQSVRDLYYQIAQTQSQIESAVANEKYLVELQAETDRDLAQEAALKADSLAVRAKLSQQRYQFLTLRDALQTRRKRSTSCWAGNWQPTSRWNRSRCRRRRRSIWLRRARKR